MAHHEIAVALGISRNTLEKYFAQELSEGAHRRRAEVVNAIYEAAVKGSVTAAKAYLSMKAPEVATRRGKKEQADLDARSAGEGTEWDGLLNRAH